MPDPGESYYDLLHIRRDATPEEITASYRKLAKILHPDVCASPEAEELFKAVNEAYQVLRDPKRREAYDVSLLNSDESEYGRYYSGGRHYRDPRTWYYTHQSQSYRPHRNAPRGGIKNTRSSTIPRILQVVLFYVTLFMAIIILAQLFLLPWMGASAARDARNLFEEGNQWMNEEEYLKAIESYHKAVDKLPGLAEGWRAKGLAEVRKADELTEKGFSDQAIPYYQSAVRSLETAYESFPEDLQVLSRLNHAFTMLGESRDAEKYRLKIQYLDPDYLSGGPGAPEPIQTKGIAYS